MQRGAFLAVTQPYGIHTQLASLHVSHSEGGWTAMGQSALWLLEVAEAPGDLVVGIPLTSELAIRPPVRCRRVADSVLQGGRIVKGTSVVALEVALIQWAAQRRSAEVLALVERVVRERKTTVARLRARLRRGLAGSAVVRLALDELAGGSMEKDVRRLKAALEALGVTGLKAEVHFKNAAGGSAYADLLHLPTMTLIEVDAALDHLLRQRFLADRRRDRWMLREHAALTLRVDVVEIRADVRQLAEELAWFLLPEVHRNVS